MCRRDIASTTVNWRFAIFVLAIVGALLAASVGNRKMATKPSGQNLNGEFGSGNRI